MNPYFVPKMTYSFFYENPLGKHHEPKADLMTITKFFLALVGMINYVKQNSK